MWSASDGCFSLTDIRTVNFVLPKSYLKSNEKRRFYVSVSDGRVTKKTASVKCEGDSLRWSGALDGFTLTSSSELKLCVFEKHRVLPEALLATFCVTNEMLRSSQTEFNLIEAVEGELKNKFKSAITTTLSHRRIVEAKDEVEKAKQGIEHLQLVPERAACVGSGAEKAGEVMTFVDPMVTSLINFGVKRDTILHRLVFVMDAVQTIAEIHPYAKLAWSVLSFIPTKLSDQIQLDEEVVGLLDAIEQALDLAPDADSFRIRCESSKNHHKTLLRMMEQISECGYFIQSYVKDVNFWKRFMKNFAGDGRKAVENYRHTLQKLREDFLSYVIVNVEETVIRTLAAVETIRQDVKDLELDMKLRQLPYGIGTRFNPEKGCLPETRVKFLDAISDWVNDLDPSSPKVMILFGQAGTGKSSIANEIAQRFHNVDRLTTSYCFIKGEPSSRESYRFFTTLARNLCSKYPAFGASLGRIIGNDMDVVSAQDYTTLFKTLLLDPMNDLHFVSPVFIIVDALDEGEDNGRGSRAGGRIPFHTFLGQHLSELPDNFRILITSRPEAEIEKAFPESALVRHMRIDDHDLADKVHDDILVYIRTKLYEANIDEDSLYKLMAKAEGLFQWASVACDYIANPPPGLNSKHCLGQVLQSSYINEAVDRLDNLYSTVLGAHFYMKDCRIRDNFKSVMGQILAAFEPLSIVSLNMMMRHHADVGGNTHASDIDVSDVVRHMGSLLSNVTPSTSTLPIAPLHTSFRDFLTDVKRSGNFHIRLDDAHCQLASATQRTMQVVLHFNMCRLETSYRLNSEVEDLKERIEKHIPVALSYSCRFWAGHLALVPRFDLDLFQSLRALLEKNFLFWLEVLSVMRSLDLATAALLSSRAWLSQVQDHQQAVHQRTQIVALDTVIEDAVAFVRYFSIPMAQSAPHIYISALPFAPSSSAISKLYEGRFPRTLFLERGQLKGWPPLLLSMSVPERSSWIYCVAVSMNGKFIAGGLSRNRVCVWDASTGMIVAGPLNLIANATSTQMSDGNSHDNGLRKFVSSVVFSHDGRYLASGFSHGGIHIWEVDCEREGDIESKRMLLQQHTTFISALSFSHDDKLLISGSGDRTVRVWNSETGDIVAGPFRGHNNPVWSVSFLPDNEHVLSRSAFYTVKAWSTKTWRQAGPFEFEKFDIPTGTVDTMSIFEDSNQFFWSHPRAKSGFSVCTWEEAVEGGEVSGKTPYQVHVAAFSLDGKLVATYNDYLISVWHATGPLAGTLAGGPFTTSEVVCLAFSADGRQLVSGSWNGLVRVWAVGHLESDATVSTDLSPISLAFFPDSRRIVVGSRDDLVRVLDISTGHEVVRIKEASENGVPGVAVSPSGDRIASVSKDRLHIWNVETGDAVTGPMRTENGTDFIKSVAFSTELNDVVASGTFDGTVCLWNASTGIPLAEPKEISGLLECIAVFSTTRTTTLVATGLTSGLVAIWDTRTGDVAGPFKHHDYPVQALSFLCPDGRYIASAASGDCSVCLWDSKSGIALCGPVCWTENEKMGLSMEDASHTVGLTRDGKKVAFELMDNRILVLELTYDTNAHTISMQVLFLLGGHSESVESLKFSEDGWMAFGGSFIQSHIEDLGFTQHY